MIFNLNEKKKLKTLINGGGGNNYDVEIKALQDKDIDLEQKIEANKTKTNQLASKDNQLMGLIAENQKKIETNKTNIQANDVSIQALEQDIAEANAKIDAIDTSTFLDMTSQQGQEIIQSALRGKQAYDKVNNVDFNTFATTQYVDDAIGNIQTPDLTHMVVNNNENHMDNEARFNFIGNRVNSVLNYNFDGVQHDNHIDLWKIHKAGRKAGFKWRRSDDSWVEVDGNFQFNNTLKAQDYIYAKRVHIGTNLNDTNTRKLVSVENYNYSSQNYTALKIVKHQENLLQIEANNDTKAVNISSPAGVFSIQNLQAPRNDNDAANKKYVDDAVANAGGGSNPFDLIKELSTPIAIERNDITISLNGVRWEFEINKKELAFFTLVVRQDIDSDYNPNFFQVATPDYAGLSQYFQFLDRKRNNQIREKFKVNVFAGSSSDKLKVSIDFDNAYDTNNRWYFAYKWL